MLLRSSYLCKYYQMGQMDLTEVRKNVFIADKVFYDVARRNQLIVGDEEEEE